MPRPRKPASPFLYYNASPEIIRLVVAIDRRAGVSLREMVGLLAARGIELSYETVRLWRSRFAREIAGPLMRKATDAVFDNWHLHEHPVRLGGETVHLWQRVDSAGEIVDGYVTRERTERAALAFKKTSLREWVVIEGSAGL